MDATYYIDESGNTGTDWLNDQQPYFVYGGWLLPNQNKAGAENYLNSILSKQQGHELKSKNIFKRKDGMQIFFELFQVMLREFGAMPFFGITEKKFMIAAKIVETFFDCEYNPAINTYLTHPVELKIALASFIFNNKNIIEHFSPLLQNCSASPETMKKINEELIVHFNKNGYENVAKTLIGLKKENFLEMVDEFETVTDNGTKKNRIALTGTILLELLKNIQLFTYMTNCSVDIYHDQLRGYDNYFEHLGKLFLKKDTPTLIETAGRSWLSNFPNIKSIKMVNSKEQIIIQASDLLCGFISNTFRAIDLKENLNNETTQIIETLIAIHDKFIEKKTIVWNWYASYQFEEKFYLAMNPEYKVNENRYHSIIINDFKKAVKT